MISRDIVITNTSGLHARPATFFVQNANSYPASICGRACDMACYIHLEKKGVLKRKFKAPFRTGEDWKFSIEDFKEQK